MKKETIEKLTGEGKMLPLMEQFYTIQGEGFHKGAAAYFIRIGGCDVGCHWCDVKESWDAGEHPPEVTERLADNAIRHSELVVVTGGEPLTWNMEPLTRELKKRGAQVHIETSGAYDMTGTWDWICLSPKKIKLPKPEIYPKTHELKCIIFNNHDFRFAEEQAEKVAPNCHLYLQPEWSKREKMMPKIVDYVKKNPKWRVSLQSHKYLEVP